MQTQPRLAKTIKRRAASNSPKRYALAYLYIRTLEDDTRSVFTTSVHVSGDFPLKKCNPLNKAGIIFKENSFQF